jgi:hypothetical protein
MKLMLKLMLLRILAFILLYCADREGNVVENCPTNL